jgi:hypothetical protein
MNANLSLRGETLLALDKNLKAAILSGAKDLFNVEQILRSLRSLRMTAALVFLVPRGGLNAHGAIRVIRVVIRAIRQFSLWPWRSDARKAPPRSQSSL